MKKIIRILVCIVLMATFLIITRFDADAGDSNCNWSCWGGDTGFTKSKPASCMPDLDNIDYLYSVEFESAFSFLIYERFALVLHDEKITCIDTVTGEKSWRYDKHDVADMTISDGKLFFVSKSDDTFNDSLEINCIKIKTGILDWKKRLHISPKTNLEVFGSTLFVSSSSMLYLLNIKSGELVNEVQIDSANNRENSIRISDANILISAEGNWFYVYHRNLLNITVYDKETLKKKWSKKIDDEDIRFSSNVISDGRVYSGYSYKVEYNEKPPENEHKMITCFDENTGDVLWEKEYVGAFLDIVSVNKDYLIASIDGKNLLCLNPKDGEHLWTKEPEGFRGETIIVGDYFFAPISETVHENKDIKTSIVCYRLSDGEEIWDWQLDEYFGEFVVSGGMIFIRVRPERYGYMSKMPTNLVYLGQRQESNLVTIIDVEPKKVLMNHSQTQSFIAYPENSDFEELDCDIFWSVAPSDAGIINQDGLFIPSGKRDSCVIAAECDGVIGKSDVRIVFAERIEIRPGNIKVMPNSETRFAADLYDRNGNIICGIPKTWTVSNSHVGKITEYGLFMSGKHCSKGSVSCEALDLVVTADVTVEDILLKDKVRFIDESQKTIEIVDSKSYRSFVTLVNESDSQIAVKLDTKASWLALESEEVVINPDEMVRINFGILADQLAPGCTYIGKIKATWGNSNWSTYAQITVKCVKH